MVGALDSTIWLTIRILARYTTKKAQIMTDLNKPIPQIEFPYGFLTVKDPSDEPLVYLDDEFECDSDYYHWKEIGGRPLPGSSLSIMARQTVREMLYRAEDMLPEGYHFRILDADVRGKV